MKWSKVFDVEEWLKLKIALWNTFGKSSGLNEETFNKFLDEIPDSVDNNWIFYDRSPLKLSEKYGVSDSFAKGIFHTIEYQAKKLSKFSIGLGVFFIFVSLLLGIKFTGAFSFWKIMLISIIIIISIVQFKRGIFSSDFRISVN